MTVSLVRIPLTLAAALAFHVSMSPPTASTSGPDRDIPGDRHAKICATARFITAMTTKGLYWTSAFTDTLVLLAPHVPTTLPNMIPPKGIFLSWIRGLSLGIPASLSLPFLPPLPLVGTTLALTGALLRYAAYHALGQFYTCPNPGLGPCTPRGARHAHALITTGPYAFVRHPGYAGLILSTTGLVMLHLDVVKMHLGSRGVSPWGVGKVSVVGMRTVALVCAMLGTVGAIWRIQGEERALRARFKGEWEAWAERVRYRLVPGVY